MLETVWGWKKVACFLASSALRVRVNVCCCRRHRHSHPWQPLHQPGQAVAVGMQLQRAIAAGVLMEGDVGVMD
jgi:hypothetical protein